MARADIQDEMNGVHTLHRQRMRERFFNLGINSFDDTQALEYLLFYSIPRRDTNPLAHMLINHFGSLPSVLDASVNELVSIKGVSEYTAAFLKFISQMCRKYIDSPRDSGNVIQSPEEAGKFIRHYFLGIDNEVVYLMCLDARNILIRLHKVADGPSDYVNINLHSIVRTATEANAASVILAHNHPSGHATPSVEDITTTKILRSALNDVEITLYDHIIVSETGIVSLIKDGYLGR